MVLLCSFELGLIVVVCVWCLGWFVRACYLCWFLFGFKGEFVWVCVCGFVCLGIVLLCLTACGFGWFASLAVCLFIAFSVCLLNDCLVVSLAVWLLCVWRLVVVGVGSYKWCLIWLLLMILLFVWLLFDWL